MTVVLVPALVASECPPARFVAKSPHGHCVVSWNREDGFVSVTTVLHPLDKGTCSFLPRLIVLPIPEYCSFALPLLGTDLSLHGELGGVMRDRLPKLNFHVFDGENSKLWIQCS